MPALSRAANYSRLWMGIAAGLAASENKWGRRATADATVTLRKRRDPLLVYRPES
jgi:hypothetical protein